MIDLPGFFTGPHRYCPEKPALAPEFPNEYDGFPELSPDTPLHIAKGNTSEINWIVPIIKAANCNCIRA
jgi:hypothetical protein